MQGAVTVELKRQQILVAEDNASIRRILCHILTEGGFDTLEARDGREAIDFLAANSPSLAILDVMMPRLDGFTACHMIKSNPRFEQMPVLICTSRDRKADVLRAISAGADDYIIKPFNREFILGRVRRALIPRERRAPELDGRHERRAAPRVRMDWNVTWTTRRPTGSRLMYKNRVRNVSLHGVGVNYAGGQEFERTGASRLADPIPQPDDAVEIVLEIDRQTYVEARGRVVHVTADGSDENVLVGMAFTELPAPARDVIAQFTY